MTTLANADLLDLATEHQIAPARCARCGQTDENWHIGYDDGRDADYLGYQCQQCGGIQGLDRRDILPRVAVHAAAARRDRARSQAEDALAEADAALGQAVRAALAADVPATVIADSLGISRQRVYQIAKGTR